MTDLHRCGDHRFLLFVDVAVPEKANCADYPTLIDSSTEGVTSRDELDEQMTFVLRHQWRKVASAATNENIVNNYGSPKEQLMSLAIL